MKDIKPTIISQYAHSPTLLSLLECFNQCICPSEKLREFYDLVWHIDTAESYGLDVWGRIVGVSRHFKITPSDVYLGFANGFLPFDQGVWSSGDGTTATYTLSNDAFRQLIMIKAMSNIIYATAYNINRLLIAMFRDRGRAYFMKIGTMKARYIFDFDLTPYEKAIITQSNVLPQPSGVQVDFYEPKKRQFFGFADTNFTPFDNGVFYLEHS